MGKIVSGVPNLSMADGCGPASLAMCLSPWRKKYIDLGELWPVCSLGHRVGHDCVGTPGLRDSLACWLNTSTRPNKGTSWAMMTTGTNAALQHVKVPLIAKSVDYSRLPTQARLENWWATMTTEIDCGRPIIARVDPRGDMGTSHMVCVYGYTIDTVGTACARRYLCRGMGGNVSWPLAPRGVRGGVHGWMLTIKEAT